MSKRKRGDNYINTYREKTRPTKKRKSANTLSEPYRDELNYLQLTRSPRMKKKFAKQKTRRRRRYIGSPGIIPSIDRYLQRKRGPQRIKVRYYNYLIDNFKHLGKSVDELVIIDENSDDRIIDKPELWNKPKYDTGMRRKKSRRKSRRKSKRKSKRYMKQGYKDRKDESIAMRRRKKRSKRQLRASANESYGRWGSKAKKSGKINRSRRRSKRKSKRRSTRRKYRRRSVRRKSRSRSRSITKKFRFMI